jgi:hypothetical protein
MFGPCRYHQERHAKTESPHAVLLRYNVIVPSAPVIPRYEHDRVVIVRALPNGVDDIRNPRRAVTVVQLRMIRRSRG